MLTSPLRVCQTTGHYMPSGKCHLKGDETGAHVFHEFI